MAKQWRGLSYQVSFVFIQVAAGSFVFEIGLKWVVRLEVGSRVDTLPVVEGIGVHVGANVGEWRSVLRVRSKGYSRGIKDVVEGDQKRRRQDFFLPTETQRGKAQLEAPCLLVPYYSAPHLACLACTHLLTLLSVHTPYHVPMQSSRGHLGCNPGVSELAVHACRRDHAQRLRDYATISMGSLRSFLRYVSMHLFRLLTDIVSGSVEEGLRTRSRIAEVLFFQAPRHYT